MKRMMFLMSVLVTVLLPSCNKENKEENADCSLCREYGITGLDAGSVYTAPGVDTSQMFFSGLKSGKVWIGGYDRSSKKQIFDYTFPEFPKQEFTVNIGYGETATCKINNYNIRTALNWENNTVIILGGMGIANNSTQDNVHFQELFFFNNNTLTANHFYLGANFNMIIPWIENGVVISSRDFASYYTHLNKDRDNFASMYTLSGDSLFYMNLNTDLYGTFDKNAAISINELIHFEREISGSSIGMFKFQRLEWLEEKTIKWETPPIQWLPLNSRIDNTSIDKNGNEWHYTWHYTEFSGAKGTYNIKININTGEYRIIEQLWNCRLSKVRYYKHTYATFNSNGTYSGEGYFGDGSGTYKAEGKEYLRYDVLSLSGTNAELKMYEKDDTASIKIKIAKQ